MILQLNDRTWVDPMYVIACYASTEGVRIIFVTGEGLTIDADVEKTVTYARAIDLAQKEVQGNA